jgi:aminopeptidase N
LEISSSYDDKQKVASVTIKQTHKTSDTTPLFRFPLAIALMDADGNEVRHQVEIKEKDNIFHLPAESAPKAVRVDPGFDVLKTFKHKRGREALEKVLKHAPEAIGRADAARELGKEGSPQAVTALREALLNDKFWGVQADAAAALGTVRTSDARAALVEGLALAHPKARRACARALGEFRGDGEAAAALAGVLEQGDPSYFVESEAVYALGRTRDASAFPHLEKALTQDSYLDTMRANALGGMAELRDERGIEIARQWCAYGRPPRARVAAIGALARFAKLNESHRDAIVDFLTPLVDDPEFMVRMRISGAFEEIGDAGAIEPLRRLLDRDLDGRIHRRTQHAIDALLGGRNRIDEGNRLRSEMDKLREDNRKLKERLDKLESAGKPKD